MKKLEFKDVSGYLPYDLACVNEDGYIEEIHEFNYGELLRYINPTETDITDYVMKPVLRPLSDLCKTITHNGKEIVPIVECAKIAYGEDFKFQLNESKDNAVFIGNGDNIHFYYSKKAGSFAALRVRKDEWLPIQNQVSLFDYLHELKIDYRGLIDGGLAIDANTLENNPYK
jgi:hypothetical protein